MGWNQVRIELSDYLSLQDLSGQTGSYYVMCEDEQNGHNSGFGRKWKALKNASLKYALDSVNTT